MYSDLIKNFETKRKNLIKDFFLGNEEQIPLSFAIIIDSYFSEAFEKFKIHSSDACATSCTVVAVSNFGRMEQCFHSDLTIIFLFDDHVPDSIISHATEMISPLFSAGLDVNFSCQTIDQTLDLAKKNFNTLVSLLDIRFVAGDPLLHKTLQERHQKEVVQIDKDGIIEHLILINSDRQDRFGDAASLLEPNLMEGKGSLRDYHTMLWIAKIIHGIKHHRDLEYYGVLSHDEYTLLRQSLDFIWTVRNRLQYKVERLFDNFPFHLQEQIADDMGYLPEYGQLPVERLLGDLHRSMNLVKQLYNQVLYEFQCKTKPVSSQVVLKFSGLIIYRNMLSFESPEAIVRSPALMFQIFEESARLKIPLTVEAIRLIREFNDLATPDIVNSRATITAFEHVMMSYNSGIGVLYEMLQTGLLTMMIPEFANLENRIQYNEYHIYPVDKHTLLTLQTIRSFAFPSDTDENHNQNHRLFLEIPNKKTLLWAALLHDIGKGNKDTTDHCDDGAQITHLILTRMGLPFADIGQVVFLVREHLFLAQTATRRDIDDEETSFYCASRIESVDRLKMLYLLTIADSMSTGPKAYSSWITFLLRDLFLKVLSIIEKGELAIKGSDQEIKKKKEFVLSSLLTDRDKIDFSKLFDKFSSRYLIKTLKIDMLYHYELFQNLKKRNFVWKYSENRESDTRTVIICAKDKPGLFSQITGVFALNDLNILETQIYTWKNRIALDIFKLDPPPNADEEDSVWKKTEADLESCLNGDLDLSGLISEKLQKTMADITPAQVDSRNVQIDNQVSNFYTVIEVFVHSFSGLLFSISEVLFKLGIDISVAKYGPKVDQVVAVFYVRNFHHEKIFDDEKLDQIVSEIQKILP